MDELETKKIRSGVKLINELKKMFGTMAAGNRRYVDPRPVLESIVDDSGHQFHIGDERDLSAFNEIFLSRITDAIKATLQPKENKIEKIPEAEKMDVDQDNSVSSFTDEKQTPGVAKAENLTDEVSELFFGKLVNIT